jgi:hypothetical protein
MYPGRQDIRYWPRMWARRPTVPFVARIHESTQLAVRTGDRASCTWGRESLQTLQSLSETIWGVVRL